MEKRSKKRLTAFSLTFIAKLKNEEGLSVLYYFRADRSVAGSDHETNAYIRLEEREHYLSYTATGSDGLAPLPAT